MNTPQIVSKSEWTEARKAFLAREKEFTRQRDALSAARRELPATRIDKAYRFDTESGPASLADLFGAHRQLLVYHLMFAPDWEVACKSCSFWADSFDRASEHMAARDTAFAAISRAPLEKLLAFKKRMGWTFPWVSSLGSDFNFDFGVSFTPEDVAKGATYNYAPWEHQGEMPGASAFLKADDSSVLHTYSTYGRGIDILNSAYNWLDLTASGRDEEGLPDTMSWVRLRDRYEQG